MPDIVSSARANMLNKPLLKNILDILDVDAVPDHACFLGFESWSHERPVDFVSSHVIDVDCDLSCDGSCVNGCISNVGMSSRIS
jgi:hypothetical protein